MIKKIIFISMFCVSQLGFLQTVSAKDLPDFTELADKQGATVVNITVTIAPQTMAQGGPLGFGGPDDEAMNEFFRRFGIPGFPGGQGGPQQQPEAKPQAFGSGFIIGSDGYILTNAHVVSQAEEVLVKLNDKREFKAKIIGFDKRTDVALIKIDATSLPKVVIGDPNALKVGEWVAAIGSPFGLENTMTAGIVSAKGRALPQENYVPFIQTDVAINPGNSGGPLFNLRGEVVGINSQIYSRSGGSMGLSFSIPIDVAIDVSNQLKAAGKVTRGWLGIAIQEISKELADSFGMKNTNGALVAGIERGGPAEKGDLQIGDVITKVDGKPIISSSDLPRAVATVKPGRSISTEVFRKGSIKVLNITVGEMPIEKDEATSIPHSTVKPEANRLGLILRDLTPQQKKKLGGKNGLLVIDALGSAAQAGIRRGDVLLGVNNAEMVSLEQFNKLITATASGKTLALLILRGDTTLYVPVKVAAK